MPREVCQDVNERQCETVEREECQDVPRTQCNEVTERQCRSVPRQECHVSEVILVSTVFVSTQSSSF